MRILLVNKFHYRKGGAETYYFALAEELQRMGHEVAFFSMDHPLNDPCEQERYFVRRREYDNVNSPLAAVRDGLSLIYSLEARRNFEQLLQEFRPDIVHLNNVHRQITLSILDAPSLVGVPVVYTAHDYITVCPAYTMLDGSGTVCDLCLDGRYRHCLDKRCVKGSRGKSALAALEAKYLRAHQSYEKINKVIAPSWFMRSKLLEGGWAENKVVAMQNFASDEILSRAHSAGADLTDRENPYLLFFGRLSKEKGVDLLIEAFLQVAGDIPKSWRLVVAGDGPEEAAIEEMLAERQGAERVELVGFQRGEELRGYVERASLAIVSSRWRENMPYSIIEAFAAGTPVIGARIGGIPELVTEGETGFSCEAGAVNSLADAIIRGIGTWDDTQAYREMQRYCRCYVVEHCSRDRYMASLVDLYTGLVDAE